MEKKKIGEETGANLITLIGMLLIWYVFGAASNVYCKQYLTYVDSSITLTVCQYLVGVFVCAIYSILFSPSNLASMNQDKDNNNNNNNNNQQVIGGKKNKVKSTTMFWLIICLTNAFGHLMTNWSMMATQVSFTHTIKAAEPIFSFFLAITFMNQTYTPLTLISIVLVVLGIMIATASEISYSHLGLITAMFSNALFSTRNVFTKRMLLVRNQKEDIQFGFYYYLIMSIFGVILILPLWMIQQFFHLIYSEININIDNNNNNNLMNSLPNLQTDLNGVLIGENTENQLEGFLIFNGISWLLMKACITHAIYNIVSFFVLSNVSAVTHAITNAMRRVVIIIAAILIFGNPINSTNIFGTVLSILGVTLYSIIASRQNKTPHKKVKSVASVA